jgi:hypothetical protein
MCNADWIGLRSICNITFVTPKIADFVRVRGMATGSVAPSSACRKFSPMLSQSASLDGVLPWPGRNADEACEFQNAVTKKPRLVRAFHLRGKDRL